MVINKEKRDIFIINVSRAMFFRPNSWPWKIRESTTLRYVLKRECLLRINGLQIVIYYDVNCAFIFIKIISCKVHLINSILIFFMVVTFYRFFQCVLMWRYLYRLEIEPIFFVFYYYELFRASLVRLWLFQALGVVFNIHIIRTCIIMH